MDELKQPATRGDLFELASALARGNGLLIGLAVKMIAPDRLDDFIEAVDTLPLAQLGPELEVVIEQAMVGLENVRYDLDT